jgi:hypothetical protein
VKEKERWRKIQKIYAHSEKGQILRTGSKRNK